MVLIGAAAWLAAAGLYTGLVVGLAIALVVALLARGPTVLTRILAALVSALVGGFAGCTTLFVPIESGGKMVKPRFIESLELAYALPFVLSLGLGLALHAYLEHWARRQASLRSGRHEPA